MTERTRVAATNLTRRHFLEGSAMAGFATFLAACGTSGTGGSTAPSGSAGSSGGTGAGGNELRFANWIGYIGTLGEPPFGFKTADGTRFLLTHMDRSLRDAGGEFDVAIYAHTHKPSITHDELGRLFINPGETSGWSYGRPSVALLDTSTMEARIVWLNPQA